MFSIFLNKELCKMRDLRNIFGNGSLLYFTEGNSGLGGDIKRSIPL